MIMANDQAHTQHFFSVGILLSDLLALVTAD